MMITNSPRTSARYVPPNYYLLDKNEALGLEVYGRTIGKICAICYTGKRQKSDWHFSFLSLPSLEERVRQTVKGLQEAQTRKKERAQARNAPHTLALGDLLVSSWGWEQTNIDYYQVTKLVSKSFVEMTPIKQACSYDNSMSGDCTPLIGQFIGEAIKRKVSMVCGKPSVKIDSFRTAYFEEPIMQVGEVKMYRPHGWSSYA